MSAFSDPPTAKMRPCAACHQMWAESMMVAVGDKYMCALCKERALETKDQPIKRYQMQSAFDVERIRNWAAVLSVVAVLGYFGFRVFLRTGLSMAKSGPDREATEEWVSQPPEKWPTFHLASSVQFERPPLEAASHGILIQSKKHGAVAATCVFPATEDKQWAPEAPKSWTLTAAGGGAVPVGPSLPSAGIAAEHGILLAPVTSAGTPPVPPLKLRAGGYAVGMKMTIVIPAREGRPARYVPTKVAGFVSSDSPEFELVAQNHVTELEKRSARPPAGSGSVFEFTDAGIPMAELIGAPVVDAFGHLAAIINGPALESMAVDKERYVTAFGGPALSRALDQ